MRFGGENRNQIIILGVLLLIAALVTTHYLGNSAPTTAAQSAAPAASNKKATATVGRAGKRAPEHKPLLAASLDPALRFDLLKEGEDQVYAGGKRDIFSAHNIEIPPVVDPDKVVKKGPPPPPPPLPGPPPIPLRFYGFATQTGQAKRIFLASTNSDDIFVGSEGQVVNRRYRIIKINNTSVDVEDILNNNKQTIPLSPQT